MPKILYVASVVKTHIMEFHLPFLRLLKEMGWEVSVAARNDYENPEECVIPYCDRFYDVPFCRNPFRAGNIQAYRMLKDIIRRDKYDVIHSHTPIGGVIARLAGTCQPDRPTIIYTAHGFHFYRGAPLLNWLLYYPVERWLARKTDVLITINREDYECARSFKAGRVEYVPGVGIDIQKFQRRSESRAEKRRELGFDTAEFLLLSVGELIPRKAHALTLKAMGELKKRGTLRGISYVICGRGSLEKELKQKAHNLGIAEWVHFLGYRNDISEICNCCDLFVFMSVQEGLPVALMEAMACGMPVVCSDIRGNRDLIEHTKNGEMIESSPKALADAIERLRKNAPLRERYAREAARTVRRFDLSIVREEVLKLYLDETSEIVRGVDKFSQLEQLAEIQSLRKELGIPLNATVLLSVGEINRNKNHQVVIKALSELENVYYVICGQGPLMERLRTLAKEKGVGERLIMAGYRTDIEKFYRMADAFVFPSFREGLPVSLMESIASGLPTVCSNARGNTELIRNPAYIFSPSDERSVARCLKGLLSRENEEAVEENLQGLQKFALQNVLKRMESLYLSVVPESEKTRSLS